MQSSTSTSKDALTGLPGEQCDIQQKLKDCEHHGRENSLDLYIPRKKIQIHDEANKIKILSIGDENNLPTKNIFLIGETGAGKTTLLNSMYNHLCNISFGDSYRMKIVAEEEDCQEKQFYESQTEGITGYLFYAQPWMAYNYNIMIIDTPGLNDTRGAGRHKQIIKKMEVFLSNEKFGVIDLHSLAFVVKANLNRSLEYYGKIIKQCLKLFGKDTENVSQILKTHAVDKNNCIKNIFKDKWHISTENEFNFDNGMLFAPNKTGVEDICGNISDEADIVMLRMRWEKQKKETEAFFQILFKMPSVSLRLTRAALKEKAYLEQTKENLAEQVESILNYIVANMENRKMLREYEKSLAKNKTWLGKETVIEKRRVALEGSRRWYQFFAHVHNCIKCEKTCTPLCHIWIPCPTPKSTCLSCNCQHNVHAKSDEMIEEILVIRNITNKDMKAKFEKDEHNRALIMETINNMKTEEDRLKQNIAKMVRRIYLLTDRLHTISRMSTTQTPKLLTDNIIHDLIHHNKRLISNLDEDCKAFVQSIIDEIDRIAIDKNEWLQELEETLAISDTAWDKVKTTVQKTKRVVSQMF